MSKIENELIEVTKVRQQADRQEFLLDVIKAANGLDDEGWDQLSPAAQKWCNAATVEAITGAITDFPDRRK